MSGKNGETPRLTKNRNTITCTMDNVVPLVVLGLSSSSSSSSSASTSRPKDQSYFSGESETSSGPVTTRSDKPACEGSMLTDPEKPASGKRGSADKEDEMDKEESTQGIPDWLQPFTDNLEDLEKHVPAHISEGENSDSEGSTSGETKTETQYSFSKDRICDVCLRTKIMRSPCRRRHEEIYSVRSKIWRFDNGGSHNPL